MYVVFDTVEHPTNIKKPCSFYGASCWLHGCELPKYDLAAI